MRQETKVQRGSFCILHSSDLSIASFTRSWVCPQTSFSTLCGYKQWAMGCNMSECWHGVILMMQCLRHTDRSAGGARPELQAADAYCWQILTSEARPCAVVLVITMYCLLTCGERAYSEVWGLAAWHRKSYRVCVLVRSRSLSSIRFFKHLCAMPELYALASLIFSPTVVSPFVPAFFDCLIAQLPLYLKHCSSK